MAGCRFCGAETRKTFFKGEWLDEETCPPCRIRVETFPVPEANKVTAPVSAIRCQICDRQIAEAGQSFTWRFGPVCESCNRRIVQLKLPRSAPDVVYVSMLIAGVFNTLSPFLFYFAAPSFLMNWYLGVGWWIGDLMLWAPCVLGVAQIYEYWARNDERSLWDKRRTARNLGGFSVLLIIQLNVVSFILGAVILAKLDWIVPPLRYPAKISEPPIKS
jgi:hypothetical protein